MSTAAVTAPALPAAFSSADDGNAAGGMPAVLRDALHPAPAIDLEALLRPDWWATLFDALYLKTDGDVVEDERITQAECDLIARELALDAAAPLRLLDLCCGQGRHALELARRHPLLSVDGLDQSDFLVGLARERVPPTLSSRAHFAVGDCRRIPSAAALYNAVILMGNSFGYFDREDQDGIVLAEAMRVLRPGGRLLIDVADGDFLKNHFSPQSWERIDDAMVVARERHLSRDGTRLFSREVIAVHGEVIRDQVYAERLYTQAQLKEMLIAMGFVAVRRAEDLTTAEMSTREQQDLGMMQQRIVIIAEKPVEA